MILGSLLHILGFKQVPPKQPGQQEGVFWLSSREDKRESDATLLYQPGKGARFDIGFIGRGNPEISLDKVSRFERKAEYETAKYDLQTIILVDSIGRNSRIVEMARSIDGTIIQMSASYWPKLIAQVLGRTLGFKHELVEMPEADIEDFLKSKLADVPLERFIGQVQIPLTSTDYEL